jgi:glycosyltransferase involved in cell wall biosynthesis
VQINSNSSSTPLVSAIIPTFNHAQFIAKSIESVLCQSYSNLELIIVDNYSEDNTRQVVQTFKDNRIHYYRFRNNGIIAASRNYGVIQSKGEVIAFLDSDDEWVKDKLNKQVKHLFCEGISCVCSNFSPIGDVNLWRNHLKFQNGQPFQDFLYNEIVLINPVINSSAIMFRDTYIKLNGLDEDPDFIAIEDWDLWLRVCRMGNIRILSEPLVNYRIHENNRRDKRNVHLRSLNLLQKHQSLGYLDEDLMRAANGNRYLLLGKACLGVNDWHGIKYYTKAFIYSTGFHNKLRAVVGIILFSFPKNIRRKIIKVLQRVSLVIQKKIYYKW